MLDALSVHIEISKSMKIHATNFDLQLCANLASCRKDIGGNWMDGVESYRSEQDEAQQILHVSVGV
jgi:hypothetical protein